MITAEELSELRLFDGAGSGVLQRIAEQAAGIRLEARQRAANESGRLEFIHRVGRAEGRLLQLERSDTFANLLAPAPSRLMLLEPLMRNSLNRMYV